MKLEMQCLDQGTISTLRLALRKKVIYHLTNQSLAKAQLVC